MPDQNNAPERLKDLIYRVLRNYRQSEVADEEGDGYPLVDALTITGHSIDMGEREIANIADTLAYEIARADRAAPTDNTALVEAQSEVNRLKAALWSIGHAAGVETKDELMLYALATLADLASREAPPAAQTDVQFGRQHFEPKRESDNQPYPDCQQEAVRVAEDDILADAEAAYWADPNNDSFDRHCIRATLRTLKGEA